MTESKEFKTLKGASQEKVSKNVLINPYEHKWLHIDETIQKEILEKLICIFNQYSLKSVKKRKSKTKNLSMQENEETKEKDDESSKETAEVRLQLVFGINEVTRHLEKDNLRLILVSASAKPAVITKHMIELCASRDCPALYLNDLNSTLTQSLNLRSVLALGFKKIFTKDHFNEFVKFAASNAPTNLSQHLSDLQTDIKETDSENEDFGEECSKKSDHIKLEKSKVSSSEEATVACSSSTDYSRFYVYKKQIQVNDGAFQDGGKDFIAFTKEEINEKEEVRNIVSKKGKKRKIIDSGEVSYSPVQIKQLKGNPRRHKKKKKRNKKE